MKKQFFLAFFACWTYISQAQNLMPGSIGNINYNPTPTAAPFNYSWLHSHETDISLIENRFFNDSIFRQGELRTRKGLYTTQLGYRFDQVAKMLQVKMEDGKQIYLETKDILYCKLYFEDHTAVFMPVTLPKQKKLTLVQVVYKTPTLQLYRDIQKKAYQPECRNCPYETANDYHYYFRKSNNAPLTEVDIDEKSFIKVLPEKKNRITSLFKGKAKEDLTVSKVVHIMGELDKHATLQ